jgi:hypothetical protein
MMTKILIATLTAMLLFGCTTYPDPATEAPPPKQKLNFVDISEFDRELASSLNAQYDSVDVAFYNKVEPNNVPVRLQKWLSAVERNGGVVKVNPPPGEVAPKDPFALLGLLGSLVNAFRMLAEYSKERAFDASKGRDAVLSLERNASGEVVVSSVRFVKRNP